MNNSLESKSKNGGVINLSPMLLMLQAEKLKNRGRGGNPYDYIDYYHDREGNIHGFIDEVVVTPNGGSFGEDHWEVNITPTRDDYSDDYINTHIGTEYPEHFYDGGGGSNNNNTASHHGAERGREFINEFQHGDVDVQLTSEVLDGLSTTVSITGLVNTVAETVKQDIGLLGRIGSWLGGANVLYSAVSVSVGLTDGEISPKDIVNGAAFFFSVGSYFVPALGFVSIALSVAACAAPGDHNHGITVRGVSGEIY